MAEKALSYLNLMAVRFGNFSLGHVLRFMSLAPPSALPTATPMAATRTVMTACIALSSQAALVAYLSLTSKTGILFQKLSCLKVLSVWGQLINYACVDN